MRKIFIAALLASCFASGPALANSVCDQFAYAIESSVKEISHYSRGGSIDNSAPRAANRKLDQSIHVGLIQANLTMMQAAKCTLPKEPIQENSYGSAAFKCEMAAFKAGQSGSPATTPLPECDRDKWVRGSAP